MAHHHELTYPENLPIECIRSAIEIFRGGQARIIAERKTLGLDVLNVQAYGMKIFIGAPDEPSTVPSFGAESEEAATIELRQLCEAASATGGGQFSSENFGARDWKQLLRWFIDNVLPIILPLILEQQT
jgi:hypothetical protein